MQPHGSLPWVRADRTRLLQVLLNLLSNAVKYNRPGGAVAIACEREEADGDTVTLSVADQGRGLSADEQARLFEPFERLGAEGTHIEGTGIGLALSRHLLEAMGGTIGVESNPGTGSRFWVRLPLVRTPPRREDDPGRAAAAGPSSERVESVGSLDTTLGTTQGTTLGTTLDAPQAATVLYIEDNPVNAMVMQAMVERIPGVRFVACDDGESGLRAAAEQRPGLILTDIQMPGMDGFEVLRRLRADPALRDIPVVAISADAMPQTLSRGREAGFDDYLTKPVAMDALHERVMRLLRRPTV
jgi:CheY-like chemotaxis protein